MVAVVNGAGSWDGRRYRWTMITAAVIMGEKAYVLVSMTKAGCGVARHEPGVLLGSGGT